MDTVKKASSEKKNSLDQISKSKQMFKKSSKKPYKTEGQKEKTHVLKKYPIGLKSSKSFSEITCFPENRVIGLEKSNNQNVSNNQDLEEQIKTMAIKKNGTGLQVIDYFEEIPDVQYVESEEITENCSYEEEIKPISRVEDIQVVSDEDAIEILTYEIINFSDVDTIQENKLKAIQTSQKQKPINDFFSKISSGLQIDNRSPEDKNKLAIFIQSFYRGYLLRRSIQKSFNRKYINIIEFCLILRRLFCKEIFRHFATKFPILRKTLFTSLNRIFTKRIKSEWRFFILRTEILKESLQGKSNFKDGLIISNYIYLKFAVRRYFNVWLQRVEDYRSKKILMKSYFNVVVGMNYLEEALKFTQLKTTFMDRLKILKHISIKYEKLIKLILIRKLCMARLKLKFLNKWKEKNNFMGMKLKKLLSSVLLVLKKLPKIKILAAFKKWSNRITQMKAQELIWKTKSVNIYRLFLVIRKYYIRKLTIFKRITHFIKFRIREIKNLDKLFEMLVLVIRKFCFKKHFIFKRLLKQSIINKIIDAEFLNKEGYMEKLVKAVIKFAIKDSSFYINLKKFVKKQVIIVSEVTNKTVIIESLIIAIRRNILKRHSIFTTLKNNIKPQGRRISGISRSNVINRILSAPAKGIIAKARYNMRRISSLQIVINPQRKLSEADKVVRLINAVRIYVIRRLSIFSRMRQIISSTVTKKIPYRIKIIDGFIITIKRHLQSIFTIFREKITDKWLNMLAYKKITINVEILEKFIIAIRNFIMKRHSIFKKLQKIHISNEFKNSEVNEVIGNKNNDIGRLLIAIRKYILRKLSFFNEFKEKQNDIKIYEKISNMVEIIAKLTIAIRNYTIRRHSIFGRLRDFVKNRQIGNKLIDKKNTNRESKEKLIIAGKCGLINIEGLIIAIRTYILRRNSIFKIFRSIISSKLIVNRIVYEQKSNKIEIMNKFLIGISRYLIKKNLIFTTLRSKILKGRVNEDEHQKISKEIENLTKLGIAIRKYLIKKQLIFERFKNMIKIFQIFKGAQILHQKILKLQNSKLLYAIKKLKNHNPVLVRKLKSLFDKKIQTLNFIKKYKILTKYFNLWIKKAFWRKMQNNFEKLSIFCVLLQNIAIKRTSFFNKLRKFAMTTNLKQIIEKRFDRLNIVLSKIKAKHFDKWKNQCIRNNVYVLKQRILQMMLKNTLKYVKRRDLRIYLKIWKEKSILVNYENRSKECRFKFISKTIKSILKSKQGRLLKYHFSLWKKTLRPKFSDSLSIFRDFNLGYLAFKKIITKGALNHFFQKVRNVSMKNSNPMKNEISKNNSAKINLKSFFKKFFIIELNLYAIQFKHLTRLCHFINTINKFKEKNRKSYLITILTKWWLVVSMKKFQKKKITNLYKKMNLLFLEAVDDLFGEKSETVQEYVEKVYNLNIKKEVYEERFQIESKQIFEVGYKEENVIEDITLIDSPKIFREIRSISENESLFFDKIEITQQIEEDDGEGYIEVQGNNGKIF